jgi:hypothetical protein
MSLVCICLSAQALISYSTRRPPRNTERAVAASGLDSLVFRLLFLSVSPHFLRILFGPPASASGLLSIRTNLFARTLSPSPIPPHWCPQAVCSPPHQRHIASFALHAWGRAGMFVSPSVCRVGSPFARNRATEWASESPFMHRRAGWQHSRYHALASHPSLHPSSSVLRAPQSLHKSVSSASSTESSAHLGSLSWQSGTSMGFRRLTPRFQLARFPHSAQAPRVTIVAIAIATWERALAAHQPQEPVHHSSTTLH